MISKSAADKFIYRCHRLGLLLQQAKPEQNHGAPKKAKRVENLSVYTGWSIGRNTKVRLEDYLRSEWK